MFTGREEVLQKMSDFFFDDSNGRNQPRRTKTYILHGLGGSGKSQIVYQFANLHQEK
jgi:hypothetical protein